MKGYLLVFFVFFFLVGQSKAHCSNTNSRISNDFGSLTTNDSTKFFDKLFSKRNSPHQFALDMEFGLRFPNYGANYFYRFERFGMGARLGFDTYVPYYGLSYGKRFFVFLPEILLNYRIYKTINVEFGSGLDCSNFYNISSLYGRIGVQTTLFKYFFFKSWVPSKLSF